MGQELRRLRPAACLDRTQEAFCTLGVAQNIGWGGWCVSLLYWSLKIGGSLKVGVVSLYWFGVCVLTSYSLPIEWMG